jgi:zinc transporter ZupT
VAGWRFARLRTIALTCAAAALVVVVAADLVPDIWNDLRETGLPWWFAAAGLAAGLAGADWLIRRGCACGSSRSAAGLGPSGPAAGLGPGAGALAVAGSAAVIAALVAHAASEGFALTTLLAGERRGRAAALLAITCVSPAAGVAVLALVHPPESAVPVLTSAVAGVLLRVAVAALRLAAIRRPRPLSSRQRDNSPILAK